MTLVTGFVMPTLPGGTVLPVVRAPHPVLATPGAVVDPTDPAVIVPAQILVLPE